MYTLALLLNVEIRWYIMFYLYGTGSGESFRLCFVAVIVSCHVLSRYVSCYINSKYLCFVKLWRKGVRNYLTSCLCLIIPNLRFYFWVITIVECYRLEFTTLHTQQMKAEPKLEQLQYKGSFFRSTLVSGRFLFKCWIFWVHTEVPIEAVFLRKKYNAYSKALYVS